MLAVRTTTRLGGGSRRSSSDGSDELGVGLVEDDRRRWPAGRRRVGGDPVEEVRDRPVGLGQAGRVVRAAQPDELRVARGLARPRRGRGRSRVGAEPGHEEGGRATLLGDDPVHRVRRRRDDRETARREERLADEVEDLVRAGADEQLVRIDAVDAGGGLDQPPVVGRRVLGQRRVEGAAREDPATISGGAGEVFRSKRRMSSIGMPKRAATSASVASQL